ncbi:hypothetical protein M885DRAFT_622218, partial [Pelagophyceae sp. CCMP2097]
MRFKDINAAIARVKANDPLEMTLRITALCLAACLAPGAARIGKTGGVARTPETPTFVSTGCCLYSPKADFADVCGECGTEAPEGSFCAKSQQHCETICEKAKWCGPADAPPAPGTCCLWTRAPDMTSLGEGGDSCDICEKPAAFTSWCGFNEEQCEQCGIYAHWCPDLVPPEGGEPSPTPDPTVWAPTTVWASESPTPPAGDTPAPTPSPTVWAPTTVWAPPTTVWAPPTPPAGDTPTPTYKPTEALTPAPTPPPTIWAPTTVWAPPTT